MWGAATENALMTIVRFVLGTKRSLFADARRFDRAEMLATGTRRLFCGVCPSDDLWSISDVSGCCMI